MNVNHKCHFHPQLAITKFCPSSNCLLMIEMCTLPLCSQCEVIHLEDHASQASQVKLIRFNEAYVQAINSIEDFLERQKSNFKKQEAKLQSDREAVLRYIDGYYSNASKRIEQAKGRCHQIEQKLSKLRKGSIKTLIFYYSGDIELSIKYDSFVSLIDVIKNAEMRKQQHQREGSRHMDNQVIVVKSGSSNLKNENVHSYDVRSNVDNVVKNNGLVDVRNVQQRKNQNGGVGTVQDVFSGIEQLKVDRNRQKGRKGIFDNVKRSAILEGGYRNEQNRVEQGKYHYNIKANEDSQQSNSLKAVPSFNNLSKQQFQKRQQKQIYKRNDENNEKKQQGHNELQTPVSFEHRYMNKFTGAQQYEAYKKQREQKIFKELNYHHNKSIEEKENNLNVKILRSSDLEIDRQQDIQKTIGSNTPLTTQRMRTMSQNNLNERERKEGLGYDLKKQVLPPEEIRKMLEKRIEQRNRILSIKKGQNMPGPGPVHYDNEVMRKGWETKDSIINQIYHDPKY